MLNNPASLRLYYEFNGLMGFADILHAKCFAFEKCDTHRCNKTTTTMTIINSNE